jgi:hypothetical protein
MLSVKGGKGHFYLRCANRPHGLCDAKDVPAIEWERAVRIALEEAISDQEGLIEALASTMKFASQEVGPLQGQRIELVRERDKKRQKLEKTAQLVVDADSSVQRGMLGQIGVMQDEVDNLNRQVGEIDQRIDSLSIPTDSPEELARILKLGLGRFTADVEEVRRIFEGLLSKVVIGAEVTEIELHLRVPNTKQPPQGDAGAGSTSSGDWLGRVDSG